MCSIGNARARAHVCVCVCVFFASCECFRATENACACSESCASTQYRGVYLQPSCVYRVRIGLTMATLGGRLFYMEYPSGVSFHGNKSSRNCT